jgi:hypothetical protein
VVGQFTSMTAISACGVDLDKMFYTTLFDKMVHNPIGRRGTAYIAQAYKDNLLLHGISFFVVQI